MLFAAAKLGIIGEIVGTQKQTLWRLFKTDNAKYEKKDLILQ